MINLLIDNRENIKFIELFKEYGINYELKNLDVGDILFRNEEGKDLLIIERKEINDLVSSLNDGRYKEQKKRLICCGVRVIYLIEGKNWNKYYGKNFNEEKLKGCIINTMVRDNLHVYLSENMVESVIFINDIYKRISKYSNEILGNGCNNMIDYDIKVRKKDNKTNLNCYIHQLMQINGVSYNIAKVISDNYNSMLLLIDSYKVEGENMLSNLLLNNNRKMGKVLSKRIYDVLFNK